MTDNRTNEPTEAQVKLAYLAHLKAPRTRGMDVYGPMRAALVAAQGAAPQAEQCCQHPKCPGGSICCCAPVLPSSTVDEDALAEVILKAIASWAVSGMQGPGDSRPQFIASAVAQWLKGEER